ncbi:mitochondrial ribonuclease P catalytic subunit isoform X3 [Alligator mississippiensis]|uniref:mitochondrial ribonuclease P catalytic subunit isoform X3 n=1 Tax=Alligator mississippiensis TaxID=8496 RepID=UPI00090719CB|nr:mitochondrial ribonuclease P catalytic subunit isoform X3 [Alligator mississippiensis]
MAFFLQASNWGLQTFLGRCFLFQPASTCQKSLALMVHLRSRDQVKGLPFTTSSQSAVPQDLRGVHMLHKSRSGSRDGEKEKRKESSREEDKKKSLMSPFSAGAAKHRSVRQRTPTSMRLPRLSKKDDIQPPEKPLNAEEWQEWRTRLKHLTNFETVMLRRMIKYESSIDVAKSLMADVVLRNGEVKYNLLLGYLILCVQQKQVAEIFDIYDIIKLRFKTLDPGCYSLLIRGLSDTERWREAILLLKEIRKVTPPSKGNYGYCIKGALNNQDVKLALELYHEMVAENVMPHMDVLQAFFDTCKGTQDDKLKKELLDMLLYFRENQLYPNEAVMQSIKLWFESIPGEKWTGRLTSMENGWGCPVCNQVLETIELSKKEYNILKKKIMKNVMQGNDIFKKTTPQELKRFQDFMENRLPYDIVLDGLNIVRCVSRICGYNVCHPELWHTLCYPTDLSSRSKSELFDVVSYFAQQNLRLLVLGRKHLNEFQFWKWNAMTARQGKVDFFFTENIDLLRDHKACLPESIQQLFFKWQRGHQLMPFASRTKKIYFAPILSYDTVVQTTGDTWHIPYDDHLVERYSYEVPRKWLCLRRK